MSIDDMNVNAIRILSADAIQRARSGHPGMPLGSAPMAYELWARHMRHDRNQPDWPNRDRFVLSAGHGSMLLYSLLHLFGYGVTIDDIKNFRQLGSKTPGHPEHGHTPGVEATTGPLGAGVGMAVGMAMAEEHLAAMFNRPGYPVIDHHTFVIVGDGCMMEGVSYEALSMAGSLALAKLIVLYDSNGISIEGHIDVTFTEDIGKRMEAMGFGVFEVADGNDLSAIGDAIEAAKADTEKPSFIIVKTEIGYGCPAKQGKAVSHGEPLGDENVKILRETLGWEDSQPFAVPSKVYESFDELSMSGEKAFADWSKMFAGYEEKFPDMKELWERCHSLIDEKELLDDDDFWAAHEKAAATRSTSGVIINKLKDRIPGLFGGSADLGPSNKTIMEGEGFFSRDDRAARNVHFGVRESAMAAIANGLALHGGIRPYVATFFAFSDYMKPMMRLASLMGLPVTYVFTHDSIGVGEDGPTHQPVEQLAMLRSQPNLTVFRPADDVETAAAWHIAATSKDTPVALVLSRQNLSQTKKSSRMSVRGGYIISKEEASVPDGIIIATGSEVAPALLAKELLSGEKIYVRVVSMPSMELFEQQDEGYRDSVLPPDIRARVAVEAASPFGWDRYVGSCGEVLAMHGFGASAPAGVLFEKFGFTADHIADAMKRVIARAGS